MIIWHILNRYEYRKQMVELEDKVMKYFLKKYKYFYFTMQAADWTGLYIANIQKKGKYPNFVSFAGSSKNYLLDVTKAGGYPFVVLFTNSRAQAEKFKAEFNKKLLGKSPDERMDIIDSSGLPSSTPFVLEDRDANLLVGISEDDAPELDKLFKEAEEAGVKVEREEKK